MSNLSLNQSFKMIFVGLLISLSTFAKATLLHSLDSFKNTQWIGIYRYMDEVLWINPDLSWAMQFTKEECIKGDLIQLEGQTLVFYISKNEAVLRMNLDKEKINGVDRIVLVDNQEDIPYAQFSSGEKRVGNLLTINGKVIEDNLESLLAFKSPHHCQ